MDSSTLEVVGEIASTVQVVSVMVISVLTVLWACGRVTACFRPSKRTSTTTLPTHAPSWAVRVRAVCWTYVVLLSVLMFGLVTPVVGLCTYPVRFTVYFFMPYFAYHCLLLGRPELRDGRPWRFFAVWFPYVRAMRDYLGLEFAAVPPALVAAEAKPDAQFLVACFPHGASSDFRILMEGLLPTVFPNIHTKCRTLAASVLFAIPVVRELSLWTGCIDASRRVAERALDNGRTVLLLPGGEREQLLSVKGRERVYLTKRMGFVKLALRKRVPVVPLYAFGTNDLYDVSNVLYDLRHRLMVNFGVCIMLQTGVWGTGLPYAVKNTLVMGKPLTFSPCKTAGVPTDEEVAAAHASFCAALVTLFDEHKGRLGYGDRTLEIL